MTAMNKRVLSLALAAVLPASALAEVDPEGWNGEAELAYQLKRGNSVSNSITAKANGEYDGENWRHTAIFEANNAESEDPDTEEQERTAESYYTSYKLDKKFGEANYIFNVVTYEKDAFSGYQYEATYALGYGRRLVDTDTQVLDAELGPGFRSRCLEPEDSYTDCADNEDDPVFRIAANYTWQITPTAKFKEVISSNIDDDSAVTRAETSLSTKVNDHLALRVSHVLDHDSDPPPGVKESDHQVLVSLVLGF
jgi:putative salt-induced outer membrane protein